MVKEDYVSRETYKLLKEKGYDGEFKTCYDMEGYTCPVIHLYDAMKWLLKTHNIFITILQTEHTTVTMEQEYFFYRIQKNRRSVDVFTDTFMKPEQACEAAIKYCLKNLI